MGRRLGGIAIGGRAWLSHLVVGVYRERLRGNLKAAVQKGIGEPPAVYVRGLCQWTEKTGLAGRPMNVLEIPPEDHCKETRNRLCLAVVDITTREFISG